MTFKRLAFTLALAGAAQMTHAHVVLEYQVAPAGKSYKATFKVGHGCGASPTRQIAVDIPTGVRGARPMPKPGWTLEVQRATLATPYTSHGRTIAEDVVRITWTARTPDDYLPNTHYDEFVLVGQLPDKDGAMYWPVTQVCAQGRNEWTEIPQPGQKLSDLKSPAALLDILPGAGASGHNH
ncbi:MAG: YcnI family protein [Proteobacteria bacterium]|nr:YcnI family protein [Pseudomonadota bacterium]